MSTEYRPSRLNARVLGRFALIAILAAFGAPAVARAFQQPMPGAPGAPHTVPGHGHRPPPPPGAPPHPRDLTETEQAAAAEKREEEEPVESINFSDFGNKEQPPYLAALINFGLLMGLYYALGKKPLAEALKNRRQTVVKEIEEAQRMKHDAEVRAKQYQDKLANLEDELAATRATLQETGTAERERIVKEAEEKAARMQKDAAFMLEQEVKQMRLDLQRETVEIAVNAAAELLKKQVTMHDQERMADEFLASLQTSKASVAS
jgi:F-type H+-transporting ATPase subunit b